MAGQDQHNADGGTGAVRPGAISALLQEIAAAPASAGEAWESGLRPGAAVGRFELVRELGRGGFGVVWEARDRELGRKVAFKAVRAGRQRDLREERLLREAEAAARLSHPNIVTLFDVGRAEQGPYLVLELLEGQTLAERLSEGPIPPTEAVRIATEVAKGLAHAHSHGVVHRDLKPENVFLCQDGQVKVLDFGLAHAFGQRRQEGGTSGYMAPEQVEGAPEDERTDVWALGAMLFEMLSGRRPYGEARPRGPAPVLEVPGAPALGPLVARMLERRPVDRPRDAGEVLQALDEVAEHPQLAAGPVRALRRPRLRLAGLAALAVLAGAAIAGAVAWWRTSRAPGVGADGRVLVAVADVVNETGERELDVLSGLLVTSLEQSRRLSVMTQARVLDLAIRGGRKDASRVDETLGREVGRAHAVRVLLLPAIRRLGTTYSLEMRAIDPTRDMHLFTLSDRATSKEALLDLLDRLSERTRTELGERRADVSKARVPLGESVTRSLEAYQHYAAGEDAWNRDGQRAAARGELLEAIRLDPDFAAAHSALAFLYLYYGRPDLAEPHWRAADENLARMPEKERGLLQLWRTYATPSAERWSREDALRLADELVKRFPDDKFVLEEAGEAYGIFHENQRRDEALRRSLDLDPGFWAAAYQLSEALGDRTAEVLEVARRAVATRRSPANLSLLARALHASGATAEAAATAREALRIDGGRSSLVAWHACFTLYQSGSEAECVPIWKRMAAQGQNALERDAASAALMEDLFVHGRAREGLRAMRAAGEPRRGIPQRLASMLLVGYHRGQVPPEVQQECLRLVQLNPLWRRSLLAWLGDLEEAARIDASLPKGRGRDDWELDYQAARAASEGRYVDAAEAMRALIARVQNHWAVFRFEAMLAEMLFRAGRMEEAAQVWPATLPCRCRDPVSYAMSYPRLAIYRARAMEQLGRPADAVRELDGVITFWKEADADLPLLVEAKAMRRRLAAAPTPAGQRAAAAQAKAPAPSIAVLPFADMSPGRNQEYFADGVAEEILNALSHVRGLKVIGRTSSFSFKGKSDGLRSIGKKLDVAHVLEGSLRQSGKRVRITAQLVRAADGSQLWSQTYDRTLDDIFEVQGSIAKAVVAALEVKLLPGRKAEYRTANQDAYASYLLGRRFAQSVSEDGQRRAIAAFEKAVELDPGYPPAWAALALARLRAGQIAALPWAEARRGCLAAAGRAIELAPDLAEGLAARAHCRLSDWDWAGAKADIDRSFALDPEDLRGLRAKASYLYLMGAFPEAVELSRRIVEKDPLDGQAWNVLGLGYWATGRLDSARAAFSRAVEVDPRHVVAPVNRAMLELEDGHPAEALAACQKLEDPEGKSDARRRYSTALCLTCSHHALGHAVESRQALQTVLDRATNDEWFMGIAVGYACRGQVDEAFEWLERSYRGHGRSLPEIKAVAVHLGAIRSDPRYKALLRKMNLPAD